MLDTWTESHHRAASLMTYDHGIGQLEAAAVAMWPVLEVRPAYAHWVDSKQNLWENINTSYLKRKCSNIHESKYISIIFQKREHFNFKNYNFKLCHNITQPNDDRLN